MIARLTRWAARTSGGDDLTTTQAMVLATIVHNGPLGASELARAEALNPTMLSRVLRRLEEAGLIARETDPDDRRAVRVVPTRAGTRRHEIIRSARSAALDAALAELCADERTTVLQALPALERLADILKGRR